MASVLSLVLLPAALSAQVYRVVTMTSPAIDHLSRERTVVIVPGGILEEHGPYLPIYADGYLNERLADTLARAISQRAGWSALLFPSIPLGNSGANDIGHRYSFPGTYTVRFETLRTLYMDLADELGAQGFRWVFLLNLHGGPNHNRALDQAGRYFHDTYGGQMVALTGLNPVFSAIVGARTSTEAAAEGLPVHSGMDETSWVRYLQPGLVRSTYRQATDQADTTTAGLTRLAEASTWPGYFGAPRLASLQRGASIWLAVADSTIRYATRILDGLDPATIERYADVIAGSPDDLALDDSSLVAEAVRGARQGAWLSAHHQ